MRNYQTPVIFLMESQILPVLFDAISGGKGLLLTSQGVCCITTSRSQNPSIKTMISLMYSQMPRVCESIGTYAVPCL